MTPNHALIAMTTGSAFAAVSGAGWLVCLLWVAFMWRHSVNTGTAYLLLDGYYNLSAETYVQKYHLRYKFDGAIHDVDVFTLEEGAPPGSQPRQPLPTDTDYWQAFSNANRWLAMQTTCAWTILVKDGVH